MYSNVISITGLISMVRLSWLRQGLCVTSGVLYQGQTDHYLIPVILILILEVKILLRFCITSNTTVTICLIVWQESYLTYYMFVMDCIVVVNLVFLVLVKFLWYVVNISDCSYLVKSVVDHMKDCLLYTSDAADE